MPAPSVRPLFVPAARFEWPPPKAADPSRVRPAALPPRPDRPKKPRPPRLENDPDRHIRQVKGGKYQARPYDMGERYNLGCFHTKAQARKAIFEFWWGKRGDLPRFVRKIRRRIGDWFLACVPTPAGCVKVGGEHPTPDAAARAAEDFVRKTFGGRAEEVLRRR